MLFTVGLSGQIVAASMSSAYHVLPNRTAKVSRKAEKRCSMELVNAKLTASVAINLGQAMPCLAIAPGIPVELPHLLKGLRKPAPPWMSFIARFMASSATAAGPQGCARLVAPKRFGSPSKRHSTTRHCSPRPRDPRSAARESNPFVPDCFLSVAKRSADLTPRAENDPNPVI